MRVGTLRTWFAALALGLVASAGGAQGQPPLKTEIERFSYALGMDVGKQMAKLDVEVDQAVLVRGVIDAMSGGKTLLSEEEARAVILAMQAERKRRQYQYRAGVTGDAKKAGEAFLAENATKPGVVTLPSGLQYVILKEGSGKRPTDADTVEVSYRGTFIDGTEFDSSRRQGKPATFQLSAVIPGWREAMKLMPVGSTWQLFVPPQLAYGEHGAGREIGPNETLIFEVELLAIK